MSSQRSGSRSRTPPPARRGNDRPTKPAAPPHGEWLYGRHAALESLRAGRRKFDSLQLATGLKPDKNLDLLLAEAQNRNIEPQWVDRKQLDFWLPNVNHQGICLHCSRYRYAGIDSIVPRRGVALALDHLQDPQNVGGLLRSAEAFGVDGVIFPTNRAAEVTPAVVNASAGAVEHMTIVQITNLTQTLLEMKKGGWWVVALDQGEAAQSLAEADLPFPLVLVVGAEGDGVSQRVRSVADLITFLPMRGRIDSLNAAIAGSVALYEVDRQQRASES